MLFFSGYFTTTLDSSNPSKIFLGQLCTAGFFSVDILEKGKHMCYFWSYKWWQMTFL